MRTLVLLSLALFLSTTAQAVQFCLKLADPNNPALGYDEIKLVIQPPCMATASEQAPTISTVHGIQQGFDMDGNTTERFLLVGTCEAEADNVNLAAEAVGDGPTLFIFGPSLAAGTTEFGNNLVPVEPASCDDLNL